MRAGVLSQTSALRPRRLLRAGSVGETSAANLVLLAAGLVLSVATARALGPSGRGVFTLATTIGGLALLVCGIGLQQALAFSVAGERTKVPQANHLVRSATLLVAVPVAAAAALAALVFCRGDLRAALVVVALTLPAGVAAQQLLGVLQGLQRLRRFNVARMVPAIVTTALVVVLALAGVLTAPWAVLAYAAGLLAGLLVTLGPARTAGVARPPRAWAREIVRYGLVVNLASIAYQSNRQLAVIVIAAAGTVSDAGRYAVALGYATPVAAIASAIALHALPEIAAARTGPDWIAIAGRRLRLALVATVPAAAVMALLAPVLIPLVFGDAFAASVRPAQVLCLALALLGIAHVLHEICRGVGAVGRSAAIEAAGAIVSSAALVLVVATHGITGAAICVTATYAVTCGALVVLVGRLRRTAA